MERHDIEKIEELELEISDLEDEKNEIDALIQQGIKRSKNFQDSEKGENLIKEIHAINKEIDKLRAKIEAIQYPYESYLLRDLLR